jgi:hypothetical protein
MQIATAVQMINTVGSDASSLLHLVRRIKECFGEKENNSQTSFTIIDIFNNRSSTQI